MLPSRISKQVRCILLPVSFIICALDSLEIIRSNLFTLAWLYFINPFRANRTNWSNILKQFVGCCRRIVWLCLTILWIWCWKGYLSVILLNMILGSWIEFLQRIFMVEKSKLRGNGNGRNFLTKMASGCLMFVKDKKGTWIG